ncbi:hypothetical protein BC834DRAFT_848514 [Gloeopeniophorella convolvens]|nr:hypothetical protein BC834DRAFT_848514 [Gloeopeniophorella convolvens]
MARMGAENYNNGCNYNNGGNYKGGLKLPGSGRIEIQLAESTGVPWISHSGPYKGPKFSSGFGDGDLAMGPRGRQQRVSSVRKDGGELLPIRRVSDKPGRTVSSAAGQLSMAVPSSMVLLQSIIITGTPGGVMQHVKQKNTYETQGMRSSSACCIVLPWCNVSAGGAPNNLGHFGSHASIPPPPPDKNQ